MKLTLHRRYPAETCWEIDPDPIGAITIENDSIMLNMKYAPVKRQIEEILNKPVTFIENIHDNGPSRLRTVDRASDEYADALAVELRRYGIEVQRESAVMT